MERLVDMINSGELTFENFLKMHPFSASSKNVYRSALEGIDFFSELYIKSIDMFWRLAEISNVVSKSEKNLVIITGYRGCGKTNFLRYIKWIASGGSIDRTLKQVKDFELSYEKDEDSINAINKRFNETKKSIFNTLNGAVNDIEGEELTRYIEKAIQSNPTYINFDIGGYQKNKPLSTKLFRHIEPKVLEAIEKGLVGKLIDVIDSFADRNRGGIIDNFEEPDSLGLDEFWKSVKIALIACEQDTSSTKQLLKVMKDMPLEHLLFGFFMWEFAWIIVTGEENKKQLYLLDNIDMISDKDGKVFRSTIYGIFKYVYDSHNLFADISNESNNEDDQRICRIYENINIIVAMRETSTMRVTDHNRKIVRQNMCNFDISEDTNKTLIIKMRVELAKKLIESGKITNRYFIRKVLNLDYVLQDQILMHRLFMLNNEDVRTSDQLLSKLCEKEFISADRRVYGNDIKGYTFGMRGIVYKDIFRIFDGNNYFRDLKVANYADVKATRSYPYSYVRVILVLLYKQREKQPDRILFNDAEYVELKELYDEIKGIIRQDDFVEILDRMYSFRDEEYWNHLVTFDNVASYSKEYILSYLQKKTHKDEKKIHICITSAGKMFLDQICVHFEYFSQRFCDKQYKALFEYNSFKIPEDAQIVKRILPAVFSAVRECSIALESYNRAVLDKLGVKDYTKIISSSYYYESQFHEERIILNHVQYLNAYRSYMLGKSGNNISMNKYLVRYIKEYLNLLYTDDMTKSFRKPFFSTRSKINYNRLMVCIEQIERVQYSNTEIEINSLYYKRHYPNTKCRLFIEKGW